MKNSKLLITRQSLKLEKKLTQFGILRIKKIYVSLAKFKNICILLNKISNRFLLTTNLFTGWKILIEQIHYTLRSCWYIISLRLSLCVWLWSLCLQGANALAYTSKASETKNRQSFNNETRIWVFQFFCCQQQFLWHQKRKGKGEILFEQNLSLWFISFTVVLTKWSILLPAFVKTMNDSLKSKMTPKMNKES